MIYGNFVKKFLWCLLDPLKGFFQILLGLVLTKSKSIRFRKFSGSRNIDFSVFQTFNLVEFLTFEELIGTALTHSFQCTIVIPPENNRKEFQTFFEAMVEYFTGQY